MPFFPNSTTTLRPLTPSPKPSKVRLLEMRLRGVLVDQARKAQVIDECYRKIDQLGRPA